ncbi:hypothetical protein KAW53_06040 [Candidatus Bathyarchaeota archaeon]|jgi:hypothetical protein|nr:hypothetical protein [Candidatus Bathyarchaeota archaeon]MCK4437748.1 hypothetical protein [Candidatus Bathyarchaeota archaeon]
MFDKKISEVNLKKLESIRGVINVEEDEAVSLDETLSRVLKFYGKFVPYN